MKKQIISFVLCTVIAVNAFAQLNFSKQGTTRCGTMIALEKARIANPDYFKALDAKTRQAAANNVERTSTLTGNVTIPVVVHVVHENPNLVTEEQVDYLLNRLNLDYSGLNSDSSNASAFYGVRGHSFIQFTRARRDPNGNPTNGIEKKAGTVGIYGTTYQRVKHSSNGGLDPWDVTKYYNIWVAADSSGMGLLGIAPGIGPGNQTETTSSATGIDGVCIEISGFSNGCYANTSFNMARTAVHEIGHNFGLYHTFSGCTTGADFTQLSTGQTLPNSLLTAADDTPNQNTETSGCPSGSVLSDCGTVNKMYQNYMDYSNDACLTLFTKGQVNRMHYVLENFRSGYLTTNGALPPASAPALDVAVDLIISPNGSEFNNTTCTLTNYPAPTCPGAFIPKLSIRNLGTSTLTSVTATITVNGVASTQTFSSLNVLTYGTTVLTFTSKNLVLGTNTISYSLSAPNGGADAVATNNTISQSITLVSTVAPLTEGFENGVFPATGWSVNNTGAGNWQRTTSAAKTGTASATIDFYNLSAGSVANLITPQFSFPVNYNTAKLNFDYAYKLYSNTDLGDTLEIMISNNCGSSWTSLWKKGGTTLTTTSGTTTSSFVPTSTQWAATQALVDLSAYLNQTVQVRFRARSGYGNNLYVDNIAITGTSIVPLSFVAFNGYKISERQVQLNWKTANEVNCASFVVEKSSNGVLFNTIETVKALNGNTNSYAIADNNAFLGANYYRLKQIDFDGKTSYSNVVLINTKKNDFQSFTVYPNPAKEKVMLNINAAKAGDAEILFIDPVGKTVLQYFVAVKNGNQSTSFNVQTLSAGVYTIVMRLNNSIHTIKFIKQ